MLGLHAASDRFVAALTPADEHMGLWASRLFHAMHIFPIGWYYLVPYEVPTLFPCSLSFTQRKGAPFWLYHAIKAVAWALLTTVLVRRGGRAGAAMACAAIVSGLLGSVLWTVEVDVERHKLAQLLEFVVCTQLMAFVRMRARFKAGVYVALAGVVALAVVIETLEKRLGLPEEGELAARAGAIAAWRRCVVEGGCPGLDARELRALWWSKGVWLACEWAMFCSMSLGITSGWATQRKKE